MLARPDFTRTCDSCQKWIYDENTGRRKRWPDPDTGEFMKRPEGSQTPCTSCPKTSWSRTKTPEIGKQAELSSKNEKTWSLYHRIHGCGGMAAFNLDAITIKNMGIIHELVSEHERTHLAGVYFGLRQLNTKVK